MSPRNLRQAGAPKATSALRRIVTLFGRQVFDERKRRALRLTDIATAAGVSLSEVHRVEAGTTVSLEACVRVAMALGLDPQLTATRRRQLTLSDADPVHSALGEVEARQLRPTVPIVRIDEPYQHFQFAGRADVLGVNPDEQALLHIENRTRFPDIQSFAGSWNAKRAYLADEIAARFGVRRWRSIDHVVVALWSAEVLHTLRLRTASFASICPDPTHGFEAWWTGQPIPSGSRSTIVIFDPILGQRRSRRRWIDLDASLSAAPRYRGYADALDQLRSSGMA